MCEFLTSLAGDFAHILENGDDHNVLINVGQDPNKQSFKAHSVVLRARSPYFKTALSNDWIRKEGTMSVFNKPNIDPYIFSLLLRFMYTGLIPMDQQKGEDLIKLLIASDELLLNELQEHIQEYLLKNRSSWLQQNFAIVHKTVFQLESSKDLQEFCLITICEDPQSIFKAKDFTSLEEETLISLLNRSDLEMEEVVIWDHLLEWGIENSNLTIDINKWSDNDFNALRETLEHIIPTIRFFQMRSSEFYNKVRPFKKILPKDLYEDLKRYHFQTGMQLKPEYLLTPRYKGIKSTIIEKPHSALIAHWIDGGDNTSLSSYSGELQYEFKLLVRGSRDGFSATTFHNRCDKQGPTITLFKVNNSKHVIGGYNPLSWGSTNSWRYTRDSFIFQFNIDYKKKMVAKLGRVIPACSQYAINDSQYHGPCFGDGDLWINDEFNLAGNCSCNKESYEQSVGDMFHRESWDSWNGKNGTFAVEDYEVFQVIKLRLSDQSHNSIYDY